VADGYRVGVDLGGRFTDVVLLGPDGTGDVFHQVSAGGGGSGSPFERDPARVLEDVLDEKVSVEAARERYGVVVVAGRVDEQATAAARRA